MTDRECVVLVPGRPQSKARPRFGFDRRGGGRAYTSRETRAYEDLIRYHARDAMGRREPMLGPIVLHVEARFAVPKSRSVVDRMTGRPDLDNIVKLADALNGIVWRDDAQVVTIEARKVYAVEPALLFRATELP